MTTPYAIPGIVPSANRRSNALSTARKPSALPMAEDYPTENEALRLQLLERCFLALRLQLLERCFFALRLQLLERFVLHDLADAVVAGHARHAAAGVGRARGLIQPGDRRAVVG